MKQSLYFRTYEDDGNVIKVITDFVKNNRYYIKKYNKCIENGHEWPDRMVCSWTHQEDEELFGVKAEKLN